MRARLYFAGVVAVAWMAVPAGASASSNCWALKKLPFGEHFDEWGAHGTGKQRC
jgi:hypothetical protein